MIINPSYENFSITLIHFVITLPWSFFQLPSLLAYSLFTSTQPGIPVIQVGDRIELTSALGTYPVGSQPAAESPSIPVGDQSLRKQYGRCFSTWPVSCNMHSYT